MPLTHRPGTIIVYESIQTGERRTTLALHFPFQAAVESFLRLAKSHKRVRPLYLVRVHPHPQEPK
jgi:hypothetical protein